MNLLNMIWPALYVGTEVFNFWYLIIATIVIETFTIMLALKYPVLKSFLASFIGNLVSGFVGTAVMIFVMIFWHALVDGFILQGTFDIVNRIFTYILMCLGSVMIEVWVIKLIYKESLKKLFIPLLVGNLLTYLVIALHTISLW